MNIRVKKLVGTMVTVVFLLVYALVAARLANDLPENRFVQLAYYAVAGLIWIVPVGALIAWMQRE